MQTRVKALTMMDALFPDVSRARDIARDIFLVIGFAAITALCAQISIPVGIVPITGQTFGVLLTGALLGSKRGSLSMCTYVAMGATGMPFWFTPGTSLGVARLVGPSGGYIIGFIIAAFAVGYLVEHRWDRRVWTMATAVLLGLACIYACGIAWLAHFVPAGILLKVGLINFLAGEAVKLALLAASLPGGWYLMKRLDAKQ